MTINIRGRQKVLGALGDLLVAMGLNKRLIIILLWVASDQFIVIHYYSNWSANYAGML